MNQVTLNIDGKNIVAQEGDNLLKVARENGFDIPGLCYHKKLTPTGACRLCTVKITGQNGLVMSCTVTIKEGMAVTAFDNELEENRRHTLNYLLAEHNSANDGSFYDKLNELAERYNINKPGNNKYQEIYNYIKPVQDNSSPVLDYDASKCIKCFRCIKACDEVQGKNVLSILFNLISEQ